MRLYHFTQLECVIGNSGLATVAARIKANGGHADAPLTREDAAPGSIWHSGLLPHLDEDQRLAFRSPSPPLVWLTANPAMPAGYSSYRGVRLTLIIPSADRRLKPWERYVRQHARNYELWRSIAPPLLCEAERWYVYFGQ